MYETDMPIGADEENTPAATQPQPAQPKPAQPAAPQNPYANMSREELVARRDQLMQELGITDASQLEPEKPISEMTREELLAKRDHLMQELGMAPKEESAQPAQPQPTVYGRVNTAAIIAPSEAAAKGKRGAVESAALERAAETGQDDDYDGTALGSVASAAKSFATAATGGVFSKSANNYLQSLARGVSRGAWSGEGKPLEEMPDSAVDYMLDQAGVNGIAGIRSWFGGSASHAWRGKDNIMRQWDESEGLKYKNEAERKKARVEYAKELARGMLGIQEESKLNAESELAGREETTLGAFGRGLIQQGGYTAGYVLGAPVAGTFEGGARSAELMSDKTKVNERGEIVADAERDSFSTAMAKGAARGVVAPLVEMVGGKLVMAVGGRAISATIGKIPLVKSIGGRVSETATGKAVATFANKFNRLGRVTGMGSFPEEMVEEWEDQVLDAMIGLDRRESEKAGTTALGRAAESSSQFFTKDNLVELAKSMVLMQVLQSGAANAIDRHNSRRVDAILEHVCMVDRDKLKDWTANQKQQAFTAWVNGLSEKDVQNMVDGGSSALDRLVSDIRGGRNLQQLAGRRGVNAVVAKGRGGSTAEQVNEVLGEINASVGSNDFVERDADGNAVPRRFAAPTATGADGKTVPAWADAQDEAGDNVKRLHDAQSGVTIDRYGADRDDDTPEFTVYDTRGRRRSAQTYEEAVKRADEMAADSASRNAKLAYIDKMAGGVLRNQQVFVGDTIMDIKRQYDAKYGEGTFDRNMASGDGQYLRDGSGGVTGASFWVPPTDADGNSTLVQERDAQGNPVFVKDESGNDVPKMSQQRAVFFCLDGVNDTVNELNQTAYHEVARHSGLAKMYTPEEKKNLLKRLTADSFGNTQSRDALAAIVEDEMKFRGIKSESELWKDANAVEEIFARVTETMVESPTLKQKFMANVYRWYRDKYKSDLGIQPDELAVVVDELNRFAREGGGTVGSGGVEYGARESREEADARAARRRAEEREGNQSEVVAENIEHSRKDDLIADADEDEFKEWLEWQGARDTDESRAAFLDFMNGRKYALTVKSGGVVYGKAGEGTEQERAEFDAWRKERDEKAKQDKTFARLKAEEEAMMAALPGERKAWKRIAAEAEKNRVTAEKERAKFVRRAEKMRKAVAAAKAKEEARAKKEQDKADARQAQIDAARDGLSSNDEERAVVSRLSDDEVLRIYGILKGVVSTDEKAYKRAVNRVNKILEAHNASMDEDGNFRDNASDELAKIVEDVQGAIDEVERRILERTNKDAADAERASREAGLVEAFSKLNDERNSNAENGGKEAARDAFRNDPVLKEIDAAYAAAQTDEERERLKERFRARVVELMKQNAPKTPQDAPAENTGNEKPEVRGAQEGAENGGNGNTATATPQTDTNTQQERDAYFAAHRDEIPLNEFTDEQLGQYLTDLQANENLNANGKARLGDVRVEVANRSKSFNNWLADQRRRGKAGKDTDETRARFEKAVRAGRVDPQTGGMVATTKQTGPNARFSINVYAEETGDRQPQEFRDAGHFFVIPNGLMEYRKALANWKKRKDASPANRPTMAQFGVVDPMADWIDNFLDGATTGQKHLLFGFGMQKGANDSYIEDALNRSPLARMIVEQNGGIGDSNAYAALAEAVLEANSRYSEWRDKKVSEDAESRAVDNERKESEAVWEASYDDLAAAHDAQNAEWESAIGEIESADAFGPNDEYLVPFNRSNLTRAKRGDIIRLGNSPVEFMLESYDAESGVLTIADSFGEDSKPRMFKVTENEVKEIDDGRDSQGGDQDNAGNAGGKPEGAGSGGAGQGGGEGNSQNGSAGSSDNGLTLESVTPEQIEAERKRREQKAAIAERLAKPLKGSGPIEQGQTLLDLGGAEGGDLFNRVQRSGETTATTPTDAGYAAWAVGRDGKPLAFANERDAKMSRALFDMLVRKGRIDGKTGLPITGAAKPLVGNERKQAKNATQSAPKNAGATQHVSSANAPTGQGTPVSANPANGTDAELAELAKKARDAHARLGGNAAKGDAELRKMRASAERLHRGKIVGAIDDLLAYREAARKVGDHDIGDADSEQTAVDAGVKFRRATSDESKRLDEEKTIKVYRSMLFMDGKLYPPMASVQDGKLVGGIKVDDNGKIGNPEWEVADMPDRSTIYRLVKEKKARWVTDEDGKKTLQLHLVKGDGGADVWAAWNPYWHTSNMMLNDQFSGAHNRNLVTVECEVPASEDNGRYHAPFAKDFTGWMNWHSGPVSTALFREADEKHRRVFLSRYVKVNRVVPNEEVAQSVHELLDGTGIKIPTNTISNGLRSAIGEDLMFETIRENGDVDTSEYTKQNKARYEAVEKSWSKEEKKRRETAKKQSKADIAEKWNALGVESGDEREGVRFRRAYAPDPALRHLADALNLSPEEADALANTADALEVGSTRRDSMPSAERELVDAVSDERGLRAAYDTSRNLVGKLFGKDAGEKWHAVKRGLERRVFNYLEPVATSIDGFVERKTGKLVKTEDSVADAAKFAVSHQTRAWEDADRGIMKPLYKEIADNGLKTRAKYTNDGTVFDELLLALHGPAFNRMISERTDGRTRDGSGASTEFWLNVLRGHGANGTDAQLLDAITRGDYAGLHWAKDSIGAKAANAVALVRRLNDETRDALEKSGRLSKVQRQTWENLSPFYVPMRFDQDAGDNFMKVWLYGGTVDGAEGYTKNYTAPESRHAFGHRNIAESPVAFSIQQFSTAIQRATDNDVRRKLADTVRANPFLGEVIDPSDPAQSARLPHGLALGQDMKAQSTLAVNALEQNDNIVAFKENGDTKFIVLGPKTAASGTGGAEDDALSEAEAKLVGRAIKKTSLANPDGVFKAIRKFTRAFAVMRTTLSPEFLVSNFLADNAQAAGNLYSKFGANGLVRFEKNVIPALLASIRHERGKANPTKNRMDRYVDEWRRNGGLIGGLATDAVADINKSMEREVAKFAGDRKAKLVDFVLGFAEKMNKPFEQASRIASYVVCRQNGMSEAAAAKFAREVTVDFNQKGEWGPLLNSVYAFSNAALVDMDRSFKAFADGRAAGRAVGYGIRYGTALVALGALSSLLGFMQDDPDDEREGKPQWKDAKDHVKQNKLGARVGPMFLSVPIRGINRELYYAGHKLYEVMTGRAKVGDAAMDVGLFAVQNAMDPMGDVTKPAQAIAPSVVRPAVELMQNENFTGAQIYRQPMNPRTDVRSEMGRATTQKIWREFAKFVNSATGGNRDKRGLLDRQPEWYQHLFSWLTGSVGNDAARAANLVNDIVTGDFSDMNVAEDAGNLRNVPFVRRVASGLQGNSATFRDRIEEYAEDKRQFEDVAKEDEAVMADLRARHPYYEDTAAARRWRQELADLDKAQKKMMKVEMSTEGEDRKAAHDLRMKIQAAFVRRMEVAPGDEDAERRWFDRRRERETQRALAQDKRRKELEKRDRR